jgi:hypothetical protein
MTTTFTPGTTAPEESLTIPPIEPVKVCAAAVDANSSPAARHSSAIRKLDLFIVVILIGLPLCSE